MNRERWNRIDELLEAALDVAPESRQQFLNDNCGGDLAMKRELELLLQAHDEAGQFIEGSPDDQVEALFDSPDDALIGRSILHYEILNRLGEGGMGAVYLAKDTKLGRNVALKLLPSDSTKDRDRVRRFQQEASAASALNHPNILTIHEIGQDSDLHFIATEFVEGETLREILRRGPLSVSSALEISSQVAAALAAAHAAGIVHRDVKPENVMLRPDGLVKVLDFGLAKLTQGPVSTATDAAGHVSIQTAAGVVMGTINYMSPEQARGRPVDARADVFSLAVMVFEMVAGVRPFFGETVTDVLVAILEKEPRPLRSVVPEAPEDLEMILNRALSKERQRRHASAGELQAELKRLSEILEGAQQQQRVACPSCRQNVSGGLPFCSNCGRSLTRLCSNCAKQVMVGDAFCGFCGYDLRDAQQTVADTRSIDGGYSTQAMSSVEPERRPATILYATVSGCSAILEQLDPGEADGMITAIKQSVGNVITGHGGILDRCSGDEVVAVFGVPVAYEDDFVRVARAGLALQEVIADWSQKVERRLGQSLRLFAGISSGPVVARVGDNGQYIVTGDPFQISTRLAAHAAPGEILVSMETERLIAPYFRLEPRDPLPIDLKTEPSRVFRLIEESGVQTRIEAAERAGLTRYVGREKELSTLISSLEKAVRGEGQIVTVLGEAGVGKSRLLLEFCRASAELPVTVLVGRCQSHKRHTPYVPFIDILTDLLKLRETSSAEQFLKTAVSGVLAIDPNLEAYIPLYLHLLSVQSQEHPLDSDIQGDELRLSILDALSAIITLSTKQGAILVLLEDWHWADEGSIETLKKLAGLVSTHSLMVIVSCRPDRALEFGYSEAQTSIQLAPLDQASTTRILKSIFGARQLPEGLADLLHKRTGGNPFFIEEVCTALVETGRLRVEHDVATLDGSLEDLHLPDTVQAVIRTRLDRLDAGAQRLLRYASMLGREFSLRVLERMIGDRTQLLASLDTLQKQQLIQQVRVLPEPFYRFKHVLTQEVAYDSLLLHQRKALHRAAGEAIEEIYADRIEEQLELLAHHYGQAEDWEGAARFGVESADKASRLSRFSEALSMLEQTEGWLLKLEDSDEQKKNLIIVLLKQERLCETLGFRRRQQALIDRIVSVLDPERDPALTAKVYVRQGELNTLLGRYEEAEQILKHSLTISRNLSDWAAERIALRTMGFMYWHWGRYDDAVESNKTAVAIDLAQGDRAAYSQDLTNLGSVLRSQGKLREALQHLEEALEIHESLLRPFSHVYSLDVTANIYRELGDNEKAMEYYRRADEQAVRYKLPLHRMMPLSSISTILWEEGRYEESLNHLQEVIELNRELSLFLEVAESLTTLSQRLLSLDRPSDALGHLTEATEIYAQLGQRDEETRTLTSLAYVCEQCGSEPAEILATWERVRSLRRDRFDAAGQLEALEGMARTARNHLKNPPLALEYLRQALQMASQLGDRAKQGDLLNTMGILEWGRGNYAVALEHYQKALATFQQAGDRVHAGLMLNSIGVTMAKLGRKEEAIIRLDEALLMHRETGQQLLEGHALSARGDLFVDLGALEKAIESYEKSLAIRREINDLKGEGWMLSSLARVYFLRGENARGVGLVDEATRIAAETADERLLEECARLKPIIESE